MSASRFAPHVENSATLLLPASSSGKPLVFLNPVQEYNRDLSVACLTTYRHIRQRELQKSTKRDDFCWRPYVLDALSASGLRAIRYAREIKECRLVVANDLSREAMEVIERNISHNRVANPNSNTNGDTNAEGAEGEEKKKAFYTPQERPAYVVPSLSDALVLLSLSRIKPSPSSSFPYTGPTSGKAFDVIDLDPYGTCAPFVDAAVQNVADEGLLMVTATDMAVAASTNHHEKCYGNYGGLPTRKEWCHEAAIRMILNTLATSAARYGKTIRPLLSLSIDFYVRVFIRVSPSRQETKELASLTSLVYTCDHCHAHWLQPFGRTSLPPSEEQGGEADGEGEGKKGKKVAKGKGKGGIKFHIPAGPPVETTRGGGKCEECGAGFHVAGPMWTGRLHDPDFVQEVLETVKARESRSSTPATSTATGAETSATAEENNGNANGEKEEEPLKPFGTTERLKGMLQIAASEIQTPFYFSPSRISGMFHSRTPPLETVTSALLHAGYAVSRSHALPGSLKTNAPVSFINDVWRFWIKDSEPVNMSNIKETSPARQLLLKPITHEVNTKRHEKVEEVLMSRVKITKYPANPEPGWGPGKKAVEGKGRKRRNEEGEGDGESKKPRLGEEVVAPS
ncbi:N2,N2-dimethylguanosine tRNA methyltransferase [Atractiella rhizophila]|nr:N2,N2-dimethylguanosine tRNA methyltransferase [Atractiella rhizophila]